MLAGWWFGTFFFRYIGNNHPNWLSYFSEGLKQPTRYSRYVSGNRVYIAMGMGIQWGDLQGSGLDFGNPAGGGGPWRIDRCATRMFDAWMCVGFVIIHVSFLPMFMLVMSFFLYLVMLSSFETWPYTLCGWVHRHVESWNHPKFDPRLAQSPRLGQIQGASCDFSEASMNGSLAGVCSLMGTNPGL